MFRCLLGASALVAGTASGLWYLKRRTNRALERWMVTEEQRRMEEINRLEQEKEQEMRGLREAAEREVQEKTEAMKQTLDLQLKEKMEELQVAMELNLELLQKLQRREAALDEREKKQRRGRGWLRVELLESTAL